PLASGPPVQPPGPDHWFGSDANGRDIFSRILYGARYSLQIGLAATVAALIAAAVIGSIAATSGKVVSEIVMRIMDIIMSFPGIALAAVFVAVFGNSTGMLIVTIGFLYTPKLVRIVRANILAQFGEDYVSATKVMGARIPWILIKHVARNFMAPILTFATVLVADAIVLEASLSFINAGVRPPNPSWGNIMAAGQQLLLSGRWWPTFFPGLMILLTTLALNILSEGMTDAMAAPRTRASVKTDEQEANTAESAEALAADEIGTEATQAETTATAVAGQDGACAGQDAGAVREGAAGQNGAARESAAAEDHAGVLGQGGSQEELQRRLAELRESELARTDRLVYAGDAGPLLEVKNLSIAFPAAHGDVNIVDDVSFTVRPGETMGLV